MLLKFQRNVGCPICNLELHDTEEQSAYFKSKNLVVLFEYESTAANLKMYLEGQNFYSVMLPNPGLKLYNLYGTEPSTGKLLKGLFHGAIEKMKKGKALFENKIDQDGNKNRIGACSLSMKMASL